MKHALMVRIVSVAFFVAYPFIVYFGIQSLPPSLFGLILAALLAVRFGVLKDGERMILVPLLVLLFGYAIATIILDSKALLLYYPALVSFSLATVFFTSLRQNESFLLKIVRARGVTISAHTPGYLYRLTAIWGGFFVLNGLVSLWTSTLSLEAWTLYNGLLSYFIVAILGGSELLFRRQYKKRKSRENA